MFRGLDFGNRTLKWGSIEDSWDHDGVASLALACAWRPKVCAVGHWYPIGTGPRRTQATLKGIMQVQGELFVESGKASTSVWSQIARNLIWKVGWIKKKLCSYQKAIIERRKGNDNSSKRGRWKITALKWFENFWQPQAPSVQGELRSRAMIGNFSSWFLISGTSGCVHPSFYWPMFAITRKGEKLCIQEQNTVELNLGFFACKGWMQRGISSNANSTIGWSSSKHRQVNNFLHSRISALATERHKSHHRGSELQPHFAVEERT